ncbi:MAG: response regulator [Bacteroidales bacterium]|nr:response regulator [Bacteroidales bacterium]
MKRSLIIAIVAGVILIVGNVIVFRNLIWTQMNYQKNILIGQAEKCETEIDNTFFSFENELKKLCLDHHNDFSELFSDSSNTSSLASDIKQYLVSHQELFDEVFILDSNMNTINLLLQKDGGILVNRFPYMLEKEIFLRDTVVILRDKDQYYYPIKNQAVPAYIKIEVKPKEILNKLIQPYLLKGIYYQWLIDLQLNSIESNFPVKNPDISKLSKIRSDLKSGSSGLIEHTLKNDTLSHGLLTYYKPVTIKGHNFGLAFSYNNSYFKEKVYTRSKWIIIISVAFFALIILVLFYMVWRNEKRSRQVNLEKGKFESILCNLPIGVIIFNDQGNIEYLNQLARDMFLVKEGEESKGNTITEKFLLSGKRIKTKSKNTAYDSNQFVLYEKEGNEVILYRKEYPYFFEGKEFVLSGFIDITSLEKSRKYEAAANTAKSEFLAKMSHEIRTPMNGIIGMTDALDKDKLSQEQQEYIDVVKRSADLLLNIIDDILDYSKIEAGKMQLEEFPFRLSEEVKLSLDLFRAIIKEKGIAFNVEIHENVPDQIIGDPFRLRQVLSNLISNAVKFTHEGEIRIAIKVDEKYNGNLTLLFEVTDTGVGIPKERLESIFSSFTQAEQGTSRKYGGSGLGTTISKQLVNLMHGEIWVESPSGISKNPKYPGSRFSFTIEVYSNEAIPKDIDFSAITSFTEARAFVIGQHSPAQKQLLSFLEHLELPADSLRLVEDEDITLSIRAQLEAQTYQLVFIVDEPNFDGFYIARQLQHEGINDRYRLIMISSKHLQENYVQTKVSKVDSYLIQPFEQHTLKDLIYTWFSGIKPEKMQEEVELPKDLKILVAEDNLINQKVAETIFQNLGYKISIAVDGKEVVEMVKKQDYDVVFMDLQMPEKDGVDATVEIRGLGFQMPIIAMTATASKVGRDGALTSGMNDYITKPVKVENVKKVLKKWFT